jgi:hypothetical protein
MDSHAMLRNTIFGSILAVSVVLVMVVGGEAMVRVVSGPPAHFLYTGAFRDVQTDWDVLYGVDDDGHRFTCRERAPARDASR